MGAVRLTQSSGTVEVPKRILGKLSIKSLEDYQRAYEASLQDPEGFWASVARELSWYRPWDRVLEGELPSFRFFPGGVLNACYNCLDRHADGPRRNKAALIWEGEDGSTRVLTYQMLAREVSLFAGALQALGVGKGDVVAIYLPNLPETFVATLACMRLGAVYNLIFAGKSAEAVRAQLTDCRAKVMVTADAIRRRGKLIPLKEATDQAAQGLDHVEHIIVCNRTGVEVPFQPGRDRWWQDLMAECGRPTDPVPLGAEEPAFVCYTSGSTGKPKGLVHAVGPFLVASYAATKYALELRDEDIYWCTADLGWLTAPIYVLWGGLALGATNVVYEGALDYPTPHRVYEIMEKYRVNKFFSAPTAFRMLAREGDAYLAQHDLGSLELIASIGEPLNPEVWEWVFRTLGREQVAVVNIYGQTETSGMSLASFPGCPMRPGSCGYPFFAHWVDVVDGSGQSVPPDTVGFLVLRNPVPGLARTIHGDHDRFLREYFGRLPGMYFTGDAAVRDETGQFWVVGRVDDVINVSGHRISTMELESSLMAHPAVAEAAVVGFPDPIKGTVPVAFVTLKPGEAWTPGLEEELKAQVVRDIGSYARPASVRFLNALPKTRSGKIMRRLLREVLLQGKVVSDTSGLEDLSFLADLLPTEEANEPTGT